MRIIDKPHGVWSCKSYWKCTEVCPKKNSGYKAYFENQEKDTPRASFYN
jgi:succinate dehydrogenase/fumarate reductase-like Fe-S protein